LSAVALWTAVGLLGGLGALVRFLLDARVSASAGAGFPFGTLLVNLSGAILLGILVGAAVHGDDYLLAGTTVIGSYTTFSTWMLESHRLGENARTWLLSVNVAASLLLGVVAAALGRLIGGG
jgi:fluoride exporter